MRVPGLLHAYAAAPLFWPPSRLGAGSAWYGHVPFAHWLVSAIRPRLIVELGTHNGVSFSAFCEAVRRNALPTRCIAVDLWQGDVHAGFYSDEVYRELAAFIARHYPDIAQLCRASFAAARDDVADGSVDLLHVDGRHRYHDVREDFELWRQKLSPRAVVLFHDICEQREDFGVHRYWAELIETAPNFAFHHAHGLGVLLTGHDPPDAAEQLCALTHSDKAETLRHRFEAFGDRWIAELRAIEGNAAIADLRRHVARLQAHIDALGAYAAQLEQRLPDDARSAPGSGSR